MHLKVKVLTEPSRTIVPSSWTLDTTTHDAFIFWIMEKSLTLTNKNVLPAFLTGLYDTANHDVSVSMSDIGRGLNTSP